MEGGGGAYINFSEKLYRIVDTNVGMNGKNHNKLLETGDSGSF